LLYKKKKINNDMKNLKAAALLAALFGTLLISYGATGALTENKELFGGAGAGVLLWTAVIYVELRKAK
jgi:hypothetical protein